MLELTGAGNFQPVPPVTALSCFVGASVLEEDPALPELW